MRVARLVLSVLAFALLGAGATKEVPRAYNAYRAGQLRGRHVYDERADPRALSLAALAEAKREDRRVLVVMGGNWCPWCLALDDLMTEDDEIRSFVGAHFVLLKLDVDTSEALDDAWGKPSKRGVPVLIFLEPNGKVVHVEGSVGLEAFGGRLLEHDRAKLLEVLRRWS